MNTSTRSSSTRSSTTEKFEKIMERVDAKIREYPYTLYCLLVACVVSAIVCHLLAILQNENEAERNLHLVSFALRQCVFLVFMVYVIRNNKDHDLAYLLGQVLKGIPD